MLTFSTTEAQEPAGIATNGGVELAYWTAGPSDGVPIIVINGLGAATRPGGEGLTEALVEKGFRVIRFDNRDSGRSTALSEAGAPPPMAAAIGARTERSAAPVAYDLDDMAEDALAVLDAVNVGRAHIFGHSMGGMIAQHLVAGHPDRALSLISVSSTSGDPDLPFGPAVEDVSQPPAATPEAVVEQQRRAYRAMEGSRYAMTAEEVAARVTADAAVGDAEAAARQGAAATASGDRRAFLQQVEVPALVIHGGDDPWFPVVHAESIARSLDDARLEVIDGLGHILSDASAGRVALLVAEFARTAAPPE